jgi:deoxycytidine triphosphate deaminase
MRLCDRAEVSRMIDSGHLVIDSTSAAVAFLDEHRIALHIAQLYEVDGDVDLSAQDPPPGRWLGIESAKLTPGGFYLGITRERLALGPGTAASLHTRSRYARLGLEMLGSSNFVVPGFGTAGPAPLVFEVSVQRPTYGLSPDAAYCFALIYEVSMPRREPNTSDYNDRFPINRLAGLNRREVADGCKAVYRHLGDRRVSRQGACRC